MKPTKSKRLTIAIDVDDVLADSAKGFVGFSNERWGTHLTVEQYSERWSDMWGVNHDEEKRRAKAVYDSRVVASFEHFEAALPVLKKLADTYKLVIITSRVRAIEKDTLEWVQRHYGGIFEEVHFAGFYDDLKPDSHKYTKADLCKQVGADYLVDDHPKHCLAAAGAGVRVLMFGSYSWNRDIKVPKGVTRVETWQGIEDYFGKEAKKRL